MEVGPARGFLGTYARHSSAKPLGAWLLRRTAVSDFWSGFCRDWRPGLLEEFWGPAPVTAAPNHMAAHSEADRCVGFLLKAGAELGWKWGGVPRWATSLIKTHNLRKQYNMGNPALISPRNSIPKTCLVNPKLWLHARGGSEVFVLKLRSSEARAVRSFRASAKLRSSGGQELQSVSEAPKLESSGASEPQWSSEAPVVRSFRPSESSKARVVRSFRASVKLRSSSRQELQIVSESPKLESSGASERQWSSEARVVRAFRASVKLRSSSRQELQSASEAPKLESSGATERRWSSETRVERSFRASVKLRSSSRQELQVVSEVPKRESSGASERQWSSEARVVRSFRASPVLRTNRGGPSFLSLNWAIVTGGQAWSASKSFGDLLLFSSQQHQTTWQLTARRTAVSGFCWCWGGAGLKMGKGPEMGHQPD